MTHQHVYCGSRREGVGREGKRLDGSGEREKVVVASVGGVGRRKKTAEALVGMKGGLRNKDGSCDWEQIPLGRNRPNNVETLIAEHVLPLQEADTYVSSDLLQEKFRTADFQHSLSCGTTTPIRPKTWRTRALLLVTEQNQIGQLSASWSDVLPTAAASWLTHQLDSPHKECVRDKV